MLKSILVVMILTAKQAVILIVQMRWKKMRKFEVEFKVTAVRMEHLTECTL